MQTCGIAALDDPAKTDVIRTTLARISPETDLIVFDPDHEGETVEDEGRSLRVGTKLGEKAYAKLDDYGSAEALTAALGRPVGTRYVVTIMLASEY